MNDNLVHIIEHKSWRDFIDFPNSSDSIFRGHSNYNFEMFKPLNTSKFQEWQLCSTWHRTSKDEFWSFLSRYSSFIHTAERYKEHLIKFLDGRDIIEVKMLQLMHFLQHYGVPTPLIDFTTDKDVALYFAYSNIPYDFDNIRRGIVPDFYITIFELRTAALIKEGLLKEADDSTFDKWENVIYGDFFLYKPKENLGNKNIVLQNGLFLYLDSSMTVEYFIQEQFYQRFFNIDLTTQRLKDCIVKHHIPYFSLFKRDECSAGVFSYLLKKNKLGRDLFDDIKGIQFDMNNPGIRLECIQDTAQCECLKKMQGHK